MRAHLSQSTLFRQLLHDTRYSDPHSRQHVALAACPSTYTGIPLSVRPGGSAKIGQERKGVFVVSLLIDESQQLLCNAIVYRTPSPEDGI